MPYQMSTKKITKKTEVDQLFGDTGELKTRTTISEYRIPNEPNYVKLYLKDICALNGIPKSSSEILHCILSTMAWNNVVYIHKDFKDDIAEFLSIKPDTIKKALEQFVEQEILFREARGKFKVNPYLFGKGPWKDIQAIRLTVNYESGKRTFQSEVAKGDFPTSTFDN